ncbi:hypothetical protein Glove_348g28 [Diversispora epigaea]|uniref:Restriction endonuclease domain-containing protein n=1 Tax=Diversispora epigaea TaxID=1348612 RepID=A0A397HEG0_9GLOM|nr:hypothetical protein Glove_348g28 [Diversispora epigaea]
MSMLYSDSDSYSSVNRSRSASESPVFTTTTQSDKAIGVDICDKSTAELKKYRKLWWDQGILHPKANWDNTELPYILIEGVSLEKYEQRGDFFNIHNFWEWSCDTVTVVELPTKIHEVCVGSISFELMNACRDIMRTNAQIYNLGATRTRGNGSGKESDASFGPEKQEVTPPNGSDGNAEPWPNIVIEVAYLETVQHVMDKVQTYWLHDDRVHDVIVVKINPVSKGQLPSRMKAWHFCISSGRLPNGTIPAKTMFEFGTRDEFGNVLNIQQGACVINIQLDCLYHDLLPNIQIPKNILPDPIVLDFFFVRHAILKIGKHI